MHPAFERVYRDGGALELLREQRPLLQEDRDALVYVLGHSTEIEEAVALWVETLRKIKAEHSECCMDTLRLVNKALGLPEDDGV